MQKRSHCCLHHPMKILATGLTHPLCPAVVLIYIQPEVPGNGKNPSAMQSKKVVKVQKKPSKTRQRNSCHKLHPTMSNIHTGDALMKLCSKVSVKCKTSLTQNQTLDFRTNMDLFWGTETSRHTEGLLQNSLLCPKSIFMAKFRHSKAQTEELEAILKTTGKAQLRLLTKTEKRTKAEMAQLRKLNVEPGSSAEMKCSWTHVSFAQSPGQALMDPWGWAGPSIGDHQRNSWDFPETFHSCESSTLLSILGFILQGAEHFLCGKARWGRRVSCSVGPCSVQKENVCDAHLLINMWVSTMPTQCNGAEP